MPNPTAKLVDAAVARATRRESTALGSKIQYWVYPATEPSLGTIVMFHGYRGTHEGVEAIVGALPDFDLIVPDLPGYGHSEPLVKKHSIDSYLEWADAWLPTLNLAEKPIMMGHSFGTLLVAGQGARSQGSARARILLNAVSEPAMEGTRRVLLRLTWLFYRFANLLPARIAQRVLNFKLLIRVMSDVTTKSKDKAFRHWIYVQHLTHFGTFANKRVVVEGFDASISRTIVDFSASILEPTLIVAGSEDEVTSVEGQEKAVKTFKDARLEVIGHVGHLTHYETPDIVADAVRRFVKSLAK